MCGRFAFSCGGRRRQQSNKSDLPAAPAARPAFSLEEECKGHAAVGIGGQAQRPVVQLHDAPRYAQPDARSAGLGREERRENIVGDFSGDRPAVVADVDPYGLVGCDARRDSDAAFAASVHRLSGILQQVHYHLLDQPLTGIDQQIGRLDIEPDPIGCPRQQHGPFKYPTYLEGRFLRPGNACEVNLLKIPDATDIEHKLDYAITLINSLPKYVDDAPVDVKMKLVSSMFPEKLLFDGKSYRTDTFNEVLSLIYQQTNLFRGNKTNNSSDFSNELLSVPRTRLELARTNVHYPLKVACLPISPPGLFKTGRGVRDRTLGACYRNTWFRSANIDRILLSAKFSTVFSEKILSLHR